MEGRDFHRWGTIAGSAECEPRCRSVEICIVEVAILVFF